MKIKNKLQKINILESNEEDQINVKSVPKILKRIVKCYTDIESGANKLNNVVYHHSGFLSYFVIIYVSYYGCYNINSLENSPFIEAMNKLFCDKSINKYENNIGEIKTILNSGTLTDSDKCIIRRINTIDRLLSRKCILSYEFMSNDGKNNLNVPHIQLYSFHVRIIMYYKFISNPDKFLSDMCEQFEILGIDLVNYKHDIKCWKDNMYPQRYFTKQLYSKFVDSVITHLHNGFTSQNKSDSEKYENYVNVVRVIQ
jgi:hypothetical protein